MNQTVKQDLRHSNNLNHTNTPYNPRNVAIDDFGKLKTEVNDFKNVPIRELPKKFDGKGETKGFTFVQLRANESGYLYEVTNLNRTYYEVFKRIVYERYGIVSYPKANAFGLNAWTIESLTKANAKFDQLTKQANEPTSVIPTSEY